MGKELTTLTPLASSDALYLGHVYVAAAAILRLTCNVRLSEHLIENLIERYSLSDNRLKRLVKSIFLAVFILSELVIQYFKTDKSQQ